jgi:hypothetical protein
VEFIRPYHHYRIPALMPYIPLDNVKIKKPNSWNGETMTLAKFKDFKHKLIKYDLMDSLTGNYE